MTEFRHNHVFGLVGIECIVKTNGTRQGAIDKSSTVPSGIGYIPKPEDRVCVNLHLPTATLTFFEGALFIGGNYIGREDPQYVSALQTVKQELYGPFEYRRNPVPEYILATVKRAVPFTQSDAPL